MSNATFFVGHEFSTQQRADLRRAIGEAFDGTGFTPTYADESVDQRQIFDKIAIVIQQAQFGIFNISNPEKSNVFLELGFAMGIGKRCYILRHTKSPVPSDLAGLGRIEYEAYTGLTKELREKVANVELLAAERVVALRQARRREEDDLDEATVLECAVATYAAADMAHKLGREEFDTASTSRRVWCADLSTTRTHVVFGPYKPLPKAGRYRAVFKLKLNHNSNARDAALSLDVFGASHADRNLYAAEFKAAHVYQLFGLDFDYAGKGKLEYRVYNVAQAGSVSIDYIDVIPIASPNPSRRKQSAVRQKPRSATR